MTVLIVKHVENEGPGLIEYCLNQEKILYEVINLQRHIPFPKPDGYKHIVLLGGPMNVYEEDLYPFLRGEDLFIKESIQRVKSILGICLGAQLIAKALGAKVSRAPVKEIGWYDVSLTGEGSKDAFFSYLPERFQVFQWHEDTFEVPRGARLLATSSPVTHQAFRYAENVYALQFHLEVTEEMIREWIEDYREGSRSELLIETETKIETYTRRGIEFFCRFFGEGV